MDLGFKNFLGEPFYSLIISLFNFLFPAFLWVISSDHLINFKYFGFFAFVLILSQPTSHLPHVFIGWYFIAHCYEQEVPVHG